MGKAVEGKLPPFPNDHTSPLPYCSSYESPAPQTPDKQCRPTKLPEDSNVPITEFQAAAILKKQSKANSPLINTFKNFCFFQKNAGKKQQPFSRSKTRRYIVERFLDSTSLESFVALLHLNTPRPCVWNAALACGQNFIDTQHARLCTCLASIRKMLAASASANTSMDFLKFRHQIEELIQLWEAHVQFEVPCFETSCADTQFHDPRVKNLIDEDQTTILLFKQAMASLETSFSGTSLLPSKQLKSITQELFDALESAVYRHISASSRLLINAQSAFASVMSPLQRHHSAALPLATSKNFPPPSAKWRRSSFPFFSYTKRHCSRHLSEVQLPQNGSSLRRWWLRWTLRGPNQKSTSFNESQNGKNSSSKLFSDNSKPDALSTQLKSPLGLDQDMRMSNGHLEVRRTTWQSDSTQLPSNTPPRSNRNTIPSVYSDVPRTIRHTLPTLQTGQTQSTVVWPVDISQPPARILFEKERFNPLRVPLLTCIPKELFAETACFLIDPSSKGYPITRGDIQFTELTLYQPWELAGQKFHFLIYKNRKPNRKDKPLVERLDKFFHTCSSTRHWFGSNARFKTALSLIERFTIICQNESEIAPIAVFLPVVAQAKSYILCLLINAECVFMSSYFTKICQEKKLMFTDAILSVAQSFLLDGYAYQHLFATPYL